MTHRTCSVPQLLQEAPWLPRTRLVLGTAQVVDRSSAPHGDLVWIRMDDVAGEPVTVVVAEADAEPCSPAAVLAQSCRETRRTWSTQAGGRVEWKGPPVSGAGILTDVAITASNDLEAVQVDGRDGLLKVYRIVDSDRGESTLLRDLSDSGLTAPPLAEVTYRSPDGNTHTMAVVTTWLPGMTLDRPLLASLQRHLAGSPEGTDSDTRLLSNVRTSLADLHTLLARRYGRALTRPGSAVLRRQRLAAIVEDGAAALEATAVRHRDAANRIIGRVVDLARHAPDLVAAPAHGDLHLAHVLVAERCTQFVDLGLPQPDLGPHDDTAALRRAVECMALDVLVDHVGRLAQRASDSLVEELTEQVFSTTGGDPVAPLRRIAPESTERASRWAGFAADGLDPRSATGSAGLPYLARLMHDLRHHSERGGHYYTGLAWCHLRAASAN